MGRLSGIGTALVVALVASCGPPPPAKPATPPPLEVRTYRPLEFRADAKLAHQAVLLGTDDSDGSTLLPLAASPSNAPPRGTAPARPIDWLPALVAASALDKSVANLDLTLVPPPDADATSGFVAVRYLSAWTGAPIPASAALVASVGPDGTLAPAARLTDKIRALIATGHTRIAVAKGQLAEVQGVAAQGVELVELEDLPAAYRALTGAAFPQTLPVRADEMALDEVTRKHLDVRYKQWQQRLAADWATILQLESAGRLPQLLAYLRDSSKTLAQSAEALHKQGLVGAAYARMFAASLYASSATKSYDVLARVQANQLDDALATLAKYASLAAPTDDTFAKLGAQTPKTLGGHVQMVAAFRTALRGWTYGGFATRALATATARLTQLAGKSSAELGSDQTAQAVISVVVPTLVFVGKTLAETTLASEQLEIPVRTDVELAAQPAALGDAEQPFDRAASAALQLVDALFPDDIRQHLTVSEPDYLVASSMLHLAQDSAPKQMEQTWGPTSPAARLLGLARSHLAFAASAELVAKYADLEATLDPEGSGRVVSVKHEKAFASMLATAERAARAHARAARIATGSIPVQARLSYENAIVELTGSLGDQLDALAQLWASSAYSELAIALARE